MKKSRLLCTVFTCMIAFFSQAPNANVIIDFEGVIPVGSNREGIPIFPYLEDNFLLTEVIGSGGNALFSPSFPGTNSNGSDILGVEIYATFQIESISGDLFSILSFDGTSLGTGAAGTFEVTGNFGSGGSISTTFTSTLDTFSTYSFDSGWSGLSSVQIALPDMDGAIDNINLSTIPVPAAVWLFGSGLLGLIGIARHKAV